MNIEIVCILYSDRRHIEPTEAKKSNQLGRHVFLEPTNRIDR